MKIDNASLRFSSSFNQRQLEERQQSLAASVTSGGQGRIVDISQTYARRENVRLQSSQSAYLYSRSQISPAEKCQPATVVSSESLLQSMVSHAFSRDIRISETVALRSSANPARTQGPSVATQASVAFGQSYRYQAEEHTSLTIEGRLELADQRSIDFVLHTRLDSNLLFESGSGEFASIALRTDPLILNLQGGAAQLTDTAFRFDIDGDGTAETVSLATGGSGFIAFDRNGDGKINDGSELFGSQSGDGFADLAQHDDDGNGFIDEGDAIYSRLKFWSRDEDGNDTLTSLADIGVSAIGLQSATTPLTVRGQSAQELGVIRSTGIFVTASGAVGSVQQVDLTRRDTAQEADFAADFANAQFVPDAAASGPTTPGQPQLADWMQRLNSLRDDYLARLEQDGEHNAEDAKSLLEQLVDMLEQQVGAGDNESGAQSDPSTPTHPTV